MQGASYLELIPKLDSAPFFFKAPLFLALFLPVKAPLSVILLFCSLPGNAILPKSYKKTIAKF